MSDELVVSKGLHGINSVFSMPLVCFTHYSKSLTNIASKRASGVASFCSFSGASGLLHCILYCFELLPASGSDYCILHVSSAGSGINRSTRESTSLFSLFGFVSPRYFRKVVIYGCCIFAPFRIWNIQLRMCGIEVLCTTRRSVCAWQ